MFNIIIALQLIIILIMIFKKDKIIKVPEPYIIYDFKDRREVIKIDQKDVEIKDIKEDKKEKYDNFEHIVDDLEREFISEKCNAEGMNERAARKLWLESGETY